MAETDLWDVRPASLRLCYIADPNSPHTERALMPFVAKGHQVALIADRPVRRPLPGVAVHDLGSRFRVPRLRFAVWALMARRLVHRIKPDLVHVHQVSSAGWISLGISFHPLVVTAWGSDVLVQPLRSRVYRALNRAVLRRADLVLAPALPVHEAALSLGVDRRRLRLMPWGIDTGTFSPAPAPEALRRRMGIPPDAPVVLHARALAPIYNVDVVVQAMATVARQLPGAVLVLSEFNAQPGYRADVEETIRTLGLGSCMRWAPPAATAQELADLYRLADVVVSVPSSDSLAVTVSEAMACGVPVIVGNLPAYEGWVEPGANGLVVPIRETEATAAAILRLLQDAGLRGAMGAANRRLICERADQATWVRDMETLYAALVAGKEAA